jgi:hypothetical protein
MNGTRSPLPLNVVLGLIALLAGAGAIVAVVLLAVRTLG